MSPLMAALAARIARVGVLLLMFGIGALLLQILLNAATVHATFPMAVGLLVFFVMVVVASGRSEASRLHGPSEPVDPRIAQIETVIHGTAVTPGGGVSSHGRSGRGADDHRPMDR